MTRWSWRCRALFVLAAALSLIPTASAGTDARAAAVVDRMLRAIGGPGAPYTVDSIAFTFAVEKEGAEVSHRRHVWRPKTGEHRVEGETKEKKAFATEWSIHSKGGKASEGGTELSGEALAGALDRAWRFWVNDTFWLLMPYKLRDPGVNLAWDGEREVEGKWHDVIKVTFDQVGITPGDTYWAYIARDTGLMERWSFVLQGEKPPPVEYRWVRYRGFGPLFLSQRKERVDAAHAVLTDRIEVK